MLCRRTKAIKMIMGQCVFNFLMCTRYMYNHLIFARTTFADFLGIVLLIFFSSSFAFPILRFPLHKFVVVCVCSIFFVSTSKNEILTILELCTLNACAFVHRAMFGFFVCARFLLLLILFMCSVDVEKINK